MEDIERIQRVMYSNLTHATEHTDGPWLHFVKKKRSEWVRSNMALSIADLSIIVIHSAALALSD